MITRERIEKISGQASLPSAYLIQSVERFELINLCELALIGLKYKGVHDTAYRELADFVKGCEQYCADIGEAIPIPALGPQFGFESKQFDKGIK